MDRILNGLKTFLAQLTKAETPFGIVNYPLEDGAFDALDPTQRKAKMLCKCGQPYKLYVDGKYFCASCGDHALLVKGIVSLLERQNYMYQISLECWQHQMLTKTTETMIEAIDRFESMLDTFEARLDAVEARLK